MMARRPMLEATLAGRPLPDGLPTTDAMRPPPTAGEADVDAFLALLADRQQRPPRGPVMHRLFGPLTADQAGRLVLRHCAHHLSHFTEDPMTKTQSPIKSQ